jgi:transcriptional regulator with XRE-family HTH domain
MKIGNQLEEYRYKAGFKTQTALAEYMDCTISYLSNLESDKAKMGMKHLNKFAKAANLTDKQIADIVRAYD